MEKGDKITLEAEGEFEFKFFIEKAVASLEKKEMILEGIASTTNIDHDSERMAASALRSMESAINSEGVPLRVEHQKEDEAVIGKVFQAWVDDRNQLHVKARLDASHPASSILYNSMKTGAKMGLSVGGLVKHAMKEFSEKTGKMVKTFYDVALKEVSVTPRPSNFDSWLVTKSYSDSEDEGERFRDTAVYQEFLFENQQLDYLQAFAKSVPDSAWHKVASQENTMETETKETKEKAETTDDTTEKAVTRGEFDAMKNVMTKGFEAVNALLTKALENRAMDQNGPDKAKEEQIGDEEHSAKTSADGTDENGTREKTETETDETKKADGAMDQANPDKGKKEEIGDKAKKSSAKEEMESDMSKKTKAAKDTTDEYEMETVERAIKSMEATTARLTKTETETDETKKASEEDSEWDKKTKGMHPIDKLAVTISKTFEAMAEKMEKGGYNIVGFEKTFINSLREDTGFQEEVTKMLKVPGAKQSVSMGVPYVAMKDGRRFALTMKDAGAPIVEKQQKAGEAKSFKDLWKSDYGEGSESY